MVDLRSETLWMHGADGSVDRALAIVSAMGGRAVTVKPSRIDLCADVLLRETAWHLGLKDSMVTRAQHITPYLQSRKLTGFSIGRSKVSARLYDKWREILTKSHKFWMLDIWGIGAIEPEHRAVRVEFQIRREALRDFRINEWSDLAPKLGRLWSYCTHEWLRLVEDAELHHTQQRPLPWWPQVQRGFSGAQGAHPLVREKALSASKRRFAAQVLGNLTSMLALDLPASETRESERLDAASYLRMACEEAIECMGMSDAEFRQRVHRKQARHLRCGPKFTVAPEAPPM